MILKYQSGRKTRTNEHDKRRTSEGKNCGYTANLNQMIFYVQKYEHMMGSSGLMEATAILKGLETEGHQDEQFWGLAGASLRGDMPKISPRRWPVFWRPARSEDARIAVWQPITRGTVSPLFVGSALTQSRGWLRMRFEGV